MAVWEQQAGPTVAEEMPEVPDSLVLGWIHPVEEALLWDVAAEM